MKHEASPCRRLLLLSLLCLAAFAARAVAVTVVGPTCEGAPGKDVKASVSVKGAKNLGALQMELVYDPDVLDAEDVLDGQLLSGAIVEHNVVAPGRLRIALVAGEPVSGDGELVEVTFAVRKGATGKSAIDFEHGRAWEHETNQEVLVTAEPGTFTVTAGAPAVEPTEAQAPVAQAPAEPKKAASPQGQGALLVGIAAAAAVVVVIVVLISLGKKRG